MDLSQTKVIVFDLDGTLYEDTHHFDYYAERLKAKLPPDKAKWFEEDYRAALEGNHTLKIGTVYDVKQDLILVQFDNIVKEAYRWDGNALPKEEVQSLYPNKITMDLETMLNVGDLWWVPGSIARHYGVDNDQSYQSFLETREFMMGRDFHMNQITGLKEALESVRNKVKLVLLTNSPEPDSEAILSKLQLNHLFHKKIFMGKKPTLTVERFQQIKDEFAVDFKEILSVGDNWINEIRPVRPLGCKTIFIDPHNITTDGGADHIVSTMEEVVPLIENLVK